MRRLTLATNISTYTIVFKFPVIQFFLVHFERDILTTPWCRARIRRSFCTLSAQANPWACRQHAPAHTGTYLFQQTLDWLK